MSEGQSRVEAERAKAMDAAHVYVRTGSWQAWLDLVVAAAVVGWPLSRGNSVVLVLLAVGILAAFAAWRWLADAEVSFDADGVRITDRYWQLLRREPIHFGYAEGIQIVAQSGLSFGVVWVNDLRIAAGSGAAFRLEKVARNMGLRFIRVETSIATAAPTVLMLAAISSFFLVHGLMGWLLYYGLYGSGLLAVLIPFLGGIERGKPSPRVGAVSEAGPPRRRRRRPAAAFHDKCESGQHGAGLGAWQRPTRRLPEPESS